MFLIVLLLRLVSVAERTGNTIHFRSPHRDMIVVDVRVNGMGPYPFLFDTGATSSASIRSCPPRSLCQRRQRTARQFEHHHRCRRFS